MSKIKKVLEDIGLSNKRFGESELQYTTKKSKLWYLSHNEVSYYEYINKEIVSVQGVPVEKKTMIKIPLVHFRIDVNDDHPGYNSDWMFAAGGAASNPRIFTIWIMYIGARTHDRASLIGHTFNLDFETYSQKVLPDIIKMTELIKEKDRYPKEVFTEIAINFSDYDFEFYSELENIGELADVKDLSELDIEGDDDGEN